MFVILRGSSIKFEKPIALRAVPKPEVTFDGDIIRNNRRDIQNHKIYEISVSRTPRKIMYFTDTDIEIFIRFKQIFI